jgi:hypothetical protein
VKAEQGAATLSRVRMTMNEILAQVRKSRTDLARLIEAAAREEWAVTAWEQRAPDAWAAVRPWLLSQDKPLVIV